MDFVILQSHVSWYSQCRQLYSVILCRWGVQEWLLSLPASSLVISDHRIFRYSHVDINCDLNSNGNIYCIFCLSKVAPYGIYVLVCLNILCTAHVAFMCISCQDANRFSTQCSNANIHISEFLKKLNFISSSKIHNVHAYACMLSSIVLYAF